MGQLTDASNEEPYLSPLLNLAPKITNELIYRLWVGDQRDRLLYTVNTEGNTSLIGKGIEPINEDYDQQFQVEDIASDLVQCLTCFDG